LYTDSMTIRAIVPNIIPAALMREIILITLCDFFAKR